MNCPLDGEAYGVFDPQPAIWNQGDGSHSYEEDSSDYGGDGSVRGIALLPNVPNPFNPSTSIKYELSQANVVSLCVYDMSGKLICWLLRGEHEISGQHEVQWNGRDGRGQPVASGTYFYRLTAGGYSETRRMVLVK